MAIHPVIKPNKPGIKPAISLRWALVLLITLFFMWGVSYGLLNVLNKHFQETLQITKAQSGLLQAAYFGAYFFIALPAGYIINRYGYPAGILMGLSLYASGALLFLPAALSNNLLMFLFALFVLACGLGCLETAANPYVIALGGTRGAARRLNLAQSFNGLGQFVGPLIGGTLFFTHGRADAAQSTVKITYLMIACVAIAMALIFKRTTLPAVQETPAPASQPARQSLWQHRHFTGGVIAQFFYVAAQVGIGAFFINYTTEYGHGITDQRAAYLLSAAMMCFMLGRFFSTWLMGRLSPEAILAAYALINIALCAVVMLGIGRISVIALVAIFFFMSTLFPTIFAMGIKNLGLATRQASSFMIMSVAGGAIAPWLMGRIADRFSTALAYEVPLICFGVVLWYALSYRNA